MPCCVKKLNTLWMKTKSSSVLSKSVWKPPVCSCSHSTFQTVSKLVRCLFLSQTTVVYCDLIFQSQRHSRSWHFFFWCRLTVTLLTSTSLPFSHNQVAFWKNLLTFISYFFVSLLFLYLIFLCVFVYKCTMNKYYAGLRVRWMYNFSLNGKQI